MLYSFPFLIEFIPEWAARCDHTRVAPADLIRVGSCPMVRPIIFFSLEYTVENRYHVIWMVLSYWH